ncbi:DUF6178 family protein [Geobacter pickeringii]|uniref:Uncharacterized protein n=1 Tax=Geobacter pickeringii TaxID=345632 RepID=A0A0B5BC43_9BACT|nr:DUF6178 family protein [Geobacter pickeringii]AJE04097.1 hypothetical protein GPICK_12655 [Geobacter pickeringii]
MTSKSDDNVISLDRARSRRALTEKGFSALSVPEKIETLRTLPAKRQMDLILADPLGRGLVGVIPPQELYLLVKEIGETDAMGLWELASPEQRSFILDLELWEKWSFSPAKAYEWLNYLLEAGESVVVEQLPHLDLELLLLMLEREISVGGGIGELASDEERTADYDHTFDNIYFITFKKSDHARAIGTFLDIVFRSDRELYLGLMEGIKGELETELEELAYRFRAGRLADFGFPELDDALALYARLDPASFAVAGEKRLAAGTGSASHLPAPGGNDSFLQRVLARAGSEELDQELTYLVNNALVADGEALHDREAMEQVFQRVHGYLNIALEYLADGSEERGAEIIRTEYLRRLFQLGFSIVMPLRSRAERVSSDDYATGKALRGLKALPPRYYRAFDPEGTDGYREFRGLADVKRSEEFLATVEGA